MSDVLKLTVSSVIYETADAITINFKKPFFKSIKYKSGQFLTLLLNVNGKEERRAYSLNSTARIDKDISITVKKVEGGVVSNFVYDNIKAGDKVSVMKPLGNFTFEPDKTKTRDIVLFGGGSGITPLMSIAKSILYFEKNSTVTLVYSNRRSDSIIFKEKLEGLQQKFPDRMKLIHVLEEPDNGLGGYVGRVNKDRVGAILNDINCQYTEAEYYICGPSGMMEQVKEGLEALEIPESKINMESFTAPLKAMLQPSQDVATQEQTVQVNFRGKDLNVHVKPNVAILDAMLDSGNTPVFSCCSGICGTCKAKLVSGKVNMTNDSGLTPAEKEQGYILTCVGFPASDDVKLAFD